MLVRPPGLLSVTPGPGPEECKHLRWATGVFRGSPTRDCWKLGEPGSQGQQACPTTGRSVSCQVGILWPRAECLYRWSREDLLESFASPALGTIESTLPLGGRCASGRDPLAQDSGTARSWSLPAGALEYREPSPGDCVVIAKVPEGAQAMTVSRTWCATCPECILRSFVSR